MKNICLIITIFILVSSCKKKFEEGPYFNSKSASKRIKGNWELQVLSINGIDSTQFYNTIFKEKCIFIIHEPIRKGEYGGISMRWGQDTNRIKFSRLWTGYAKYGVISAEPIRDTLAPYFLYPCCRNWYSEIFDIRYLTTEKLILQIKSSEDYLQRLEFKKI